MTKVFDSFYTQSPGIWYFSCRDEFIEGKPSNGYGAIKYNEGSVYQGEIYYDGKLFHKLGFGVQNFDETDIGLYNPLTKLKISKFAGYFDYKKTNWIYGNGVMYLKDKHNNPAKFVVGFFSCLTKIKKYKGEFDYTKLVAGYSKEMEMKNYNTKDRVYRKSRSGIKRIVDLENLFIGDSYLEFWHMEKYAGHNVFENHFDYKKNINVGVGGTTFKEWIPYVRKLRYFPKPKRIFINLGFNDIHEGQSIDTIYKYFVNVLTRLRVLFPDSEYYLFDTNYKAPIAEPFYKLHIEWNNLIREKSKDNNIKILSIVQHFDDKTNYHDADGCHINEKGYGVLINEIFKIIKQ